MTPKIPTDSHPAPDQPQPRPTRPRSLPAPPFSPSRSSAARHPRPNSRECSSPPDSFFLSRSTGANVIKSDFSPLSLARAFTGQDAVISLLGPEASLSVSLLHFFRYLGVAAQIARASSLTGGRIWRLKLVLAVDIAEGEIRHDLFDVLECPDLYIKSQPAEPHDLNSSVHVRSRP